MSRIVRKFPFRPSALIAAALAIGGAAPAGAQDLVHRFIDPSFGGNPFYSDHLLTIANIDRPSAPTTPATTTSQEELIAQQLRAQLLSQLSGTIRDEIAGAAVGASNTFTFGNQTITYRRTATETTVTFTNTDTGEVNTVVIPAAASATGSAASTSVAATGTRAVTTASAVPGTLSGVSLSGAAPLAYTSGQALAGATLSATSSTRPSAEQALLGASGGATGPALAPF